jgi:poly(A) polymerase Pap1
MRVACKDVRNSPFSRELSVAGTEQSKCRVLTHRFEAARKFVKQVPKRRRRSDRGGLKEAGGKILFNPHSKR